MTTENLPPFQEIPILTPIEDISKAHSHYDALVVISSDLDKENFIGKAQVDENKKLDKKVGETLSIHFCPLVPGGRLIISPTGPTNRDYDDVRCWVDASRAGILRAKQAGSIRPIILLPTSPNLELFPNYANVLQVSLLAALQELYEPIQARMHLGREKIEPISEIGFHAPWLPPTTLSQIATVVSAMEKGKRLARDLSDSDPEYMGPVRFTEFIKKAFEPIKNVRLTVISNSSELLKEYPLLSAVARASQPVPNHHPRVIRLEYDGEGEIEDTLMLAGKGVTYDTGGSDVKIKGNMAGMSRDKCGASNVAGFVLSTALLSPKGLRVVAELGVVRNSIGAFGYVADEVITGHSGVRVKVIDTDCEGRMVLADCLSHLRESSLHAKNPHLMSMATLTYHVMDAIGPYVAIVPNGPSKLEGCPEKLRNCGSIWGDLFEISTLAREDFRVLKKDLTSFDVLQEDRVATRGHQFPAAFLIIASGLEKHGRDSKHPIKYSHLDIAGNACENCDYKFGKPTGCTIVALTACYVLPKLNL